MKQNFDPTIIQRKKQKEEGQPGLDLRHPTYPSNEGIKSRVFQRI